MFYSYSRNCLAFAHCQSTSYRRFLPRAAAGHRRRWSADRLSSGRFPSALAYYDGLFSGILSKKLSFSPKRVTILASFAGARSSRAARQQLHGQLLLSHLNLYRRQQTQQHILQR